MHFFFFLHAPLSCLGKHHPSSFPQSPPALPPHPHQHGRLLWHRTGETTVSAMRHASLLSLQKYFSVLTRLFSRTTGYILFQKKLLLSVNIPTCLMLLQSGECSGEQPEAFPREEEERFETTQSLPGPHHSQVCVFTQPQRVSLAFPQGHLCH